jgi:hypothetical protein
MGLFPIIIWQPKLVVSTDELRADDENVREVPCATVPVLVTVRVGFAVMPRSHVPLKKGVATARTSLGVNARSKGDGIAVPVPERIFRTV